MIENYHAAVSKYYLTHFLSMGRDSSQISSFSAFEGASLCVIVKWGSGHTWMVLKKEQTHTDASAMQSLRGKMSTRIKKDVGGIC